MWLFADDEVPYPMRTLFILPCLLFDYIKNYEQFTIKTFIGIRALLTKTYINIPYDTYTDLSMFWEVSRVQPPLGHPSER